MNVIDRVKELLAAAEDDRTCADKHSMFRGGCKECERYSNKGAVAAKRTLEGMGFAPVGNRYPAAQALVASQEALSATDGYLEEWFGWRTGKVEVPDNAAGRAVSTIRAALRLDGLAKVMKEK